MSRSEAGALYHFLYGHLSNLLRGDLNAAKRDASNSGSSACYLKGDGVQLVDSRFFTWREMQQIVERGAKDGRREAYFDAYRAYVNAATEKLPVGRPKDEGWNDRPEVIAHRERYSLAVRELSAAGRAIVEAGLTHKASQEPLTLF